MPRDSRGHYPDVDKYKDRPLSAFVKKICLETDSTETDIAQILGISVNRMHSKFVRNYFTINDILTILNAFGYEIEIKEKKKC